MTDVEKAPSSSSHDGSKIPSGSVDNRPDAPMPDTIPDHRQDLAAELAAMSPEKYAEMEKALLWKIDKKLIPWMTLLYLMSFLDRVNIGAANLVGLSRDLGLTSLQYSNASMIFFVSYVAFEVPSNLVLKKFRPSRWIPATMICWAIFQIFMGLVTNYGQLLALRFCLGLFESGLFPGLNFFLTGWYRREEISKRSSFFFSGAVAAGAFGGIFAYALSRMEGVGGKSGWSWIFIWEGILTLFVAIASFWMVHDWPDQARFLTPLEKEMVIMRLKQEQGLASEGKFSWRVLKKGLKDWKVYCLMLMYMGAAEPFYSGSLFTPAIVAALGRFSIPQSLLLSTPPYVLSFFTTLTTAYFSDKYKRRGFFLMGWSVVAAIGYIILLAVPPSQPGPRYFAVFLTSAGCGPLIGITIAWTSNTWGNHYKRAIGMGLVFSSGNSAGIISSQAYRAKDAPKYFPGHGTALAFAIVCGLSAAFFYFALKRENARRDAKYGPPPGPHEVYELESEEYKKKWGLEGMTRDEIVELGDDHPAFRYIL